METRQTSRHSERDAYQLKDSRQLYNLSGSTQSFRIPLLRHTCDLFLFQEEAVRS